MNKNIRSKSVKESLLDYNNLAATLKENTQNAVKDLLAETVRNTYASLLSEDEEDDYDEEEVEDTDTDNDETDITSSTEEDETSEDTGMDSEPGDEETEIEDETDSETILDDDEDAEDVDIEDYDDDDLADEDDSEAWSEFDKYKIGDGQYDFSNAKDEEVVKVYKLLKNDDQVMVNQKGDGQVEIKDNETGSEYIIDMNGGLDTEVETETEISFDDDEPTTDTDNFDTMKESTERLYELVLEYDSHVGYTDNYQKKDVMTTPGMEEPGKGNDWDKGIPHGKEKPWSKKKDSANAPFTGQKGKKVEEDIDLNAAEDLAECGDVELEEATNVGGFVQQNSTSKSHVPNSSGRSARNASKAGKKVKGTANPRYSNTGDVDVEVNVTSPTNESIMKKANKILAENKALKKALGQWKNTLEEAAVTNLNLGQIIKLISENTTTREEKKEIIARFGKEAKTVEQSHNLFEAISNDLKKNRQMNPLNEETTITATGSKRINETQIYQSNDLLESLDLMHRLCK